MINILFGGNYKVYDGITLCLMSMTKHTSEALNIFILSTDLHEQNPNFLPITNDMVAELDNLVKQKNPQSQVQLIMLGDEFKTWIAQSQNRLNTYTPYAFLRLFADTVPTLPEKIIYLDTDIMLNGDIAELFANDVTDYEMGVVLDRYGRFFISRHYFNSGVLLLNLKKLRETKLLEKVKTMCLNKKMAFPDQSALNNCCQKVLYLPRRFNEQGNLKKDTVIQHFSKRIIWVPFHTINVKPWQIDDVHKKYKWTQYDDIYAQFLEYKKDKQ